MSQKGERRLRPDHHTAVRSQVGVAGDFLKAIGPVVAAAGVDFDIDIRDVLLDPAAVEFDFVDPAFCR
jgi:hypothetical protein